MDHHWIDTQNFGTSQSYKVYGNAIKVLCNNVSSYDISNNDGSYVVKVGITDEQSFTIGPLIENEGKIWTIKSVMNHRMSESTAVFVFEV